MGIATKWRQPEVEPNTKWLLLEVEPATKCQGVKAVPCSNSNSSTEEALIDRIYCLKALACLHTQFPSVTQGRSLGCVAAAAEAMLFRIGADNQIFNGQSEAC